VHRDWLVATFGVTSSFVMRMMILGSVMLASLITNAQKGLQIGAKAIPSWSWFLNEDDEANPTGGPSFGVGFNYHWRDGIGVGLDFLWGRSTQELKLSGTEWSNELSLFKVPLLLYFNSPSDDKIPFLGYIGFEYVKVRSVSAESNGHDIDGVTFTDVNGQPIATLHSDELYAATNFGAVLGLGPGANIKGGKIQVTAIVRAEYLFNDAENKDDGTGKLIWGDRKKTSLCSVGIDLGIKYTFGSSGG
jgi:hypothetical protein